MIAIKKSQKILIPVLIIGIYILFQFIFFKLDTPLFGCILASIGVICVMIYNSLNDSDKENQKIEDYRKIFKFQLDRVIEEANLNYKFNEENIAAREKNPNEKVIYSVVNTHSIEIIRKIPIEYLLKMYPVKKDKNIMDIFKNILNIEDAQNLIQEGLSNENLFSDNIPLIKSNNKILGEKIEYLSNSFLK